VIPSRNMTCKTGAEVDDALLMKRAWRMALRIVKMAMYTSYINWGDESY
jgi:hypothetical protein